ncbi:nucleotide sugar dehydrogenase [Flexivirga meconopsidis]|uniref:nucleotide sugar dehydrogenase n=1 Tax=Flexivirga meconopsidis TaxID=2977121 RepID=UPI00223FF8DA|nr:nucleotide sugar dehydrogenase [Flexivirga meconopsidis]
MSLLTPGFETDARTVSVAQFDTALSDLTLRIGVVGLGFTGLPLAHGFADAGLEVVGVDLDARKVELLTDGISYLPDVTVADLADVHGKLHASTDCESLAGCEAIIICVPTPVTAQHGADLSAVWSATDAVAPYLQLGTLVVLQSTVPPGTTERMARRLAAASGLVPGTDFHVAVAPERVDPGNTDGWTVTNTAKLVGGLTPECTRRATLLFELICTTVCPVSTPAVAELSKVYENTFRMVNIALAFDLADLCRPLGIRPREVIDAAATKPFGFLPHYPGPGVGGECIPVDPNFLLEQAAAQGTSMPVLSVARDRIVNRPCETVDRCVEVLLDADIRVYGARIMVVGIAYKPGVPDLRNAPGVEILARLARLGAEVCYHDPLAPSVHIDGEDHYSVPWNDQTISRQDLVVLVTAHGPLLTDPRWDFAARVLDTKGELRPAANVQLL